MLAAVVIKAAVLSAAAAVSASASGAAAVVAIAGVKPKLGKRCLFVGWLRNVPATG